MNKNFENKNSHKYQYEVYDSYKNDMVFSGSTQEVADYIKCTTANVHIAEKKGTLIGKRYMVQLLGKRRETDPNSTSGREPKRFDVFKGNSLLYANKTVNEICDKLLIGKSTVYENINNGTKCREGSSFKPAREWVGLEEQAPIIDDTPCCTPPRIVTETVCDTELDTKMEIETKCESEITNLDKYLDIIHSAMVSNNDVKTPVFSELKEFKEWLLSTYHNPIPLKSWEKEMLECYTSITPFFNEQVLMLMKTKGNFSGVEDVLMTIGDILANCEVQD